MTTTRRHPRGFTLMEAMAALAIAGVIIAGATGAVMNINRLIADTNKKTAVWDEAKRLEEFLVARAQAAGGGQLRPHASVFIENAGGALAPGIACRTITGIPACSTNGADRLSLFVQDPNFPECPIPTTVGANLSIGAGPGGAACCLDEGPGGAANAFENREALVVTANGTVFSVHLFNRTSAGGGCGINAPPGQGAGLLPTALAAGTNGTLIIATAETMFVEANQLKTWADANGDFQAQAGEITIIHDRVYDMQLAAGYDGRPEDGRLVDSNSAADEFLFNTNTDTAMPASVTITQLRMLQIALAVGTPSTVSGGNQVRLLDRPTAFSQAGIYLTATSSKAYMRNLALFTQ